MTAGGEGAEMEEGQQAGGQSAGLCADEPQRGSAMQLGQPGVQREAWVLIQALPSLPVCPWAGPSVLSCHPRELEQLSVATGKRMWHRQAEGGTF